MNSRIENSKRNILGLALNKIVNLMMPFLSRTAMIYYLGTIYLGLNSLFTSIISVLSLAELGIGTAMVFSMYKPMANHDDETVCALLELYRRIYCVIGTVILIAGMLFIPFLPRIIKGEYPASVNLYGIYLIMLFNTVISYYLFAYKESIFIASQRTDLLSNINTVICIILNIGQTLLIIFTKNYYLFCTFIPITTIIGMFCKNYIIGKRFPQYFCHGSIDRAMKSDIKKRVAGLFIYKVCDVLRFSLDSIVLSAFLGLAILAKYNNYYYIMSAVSGMVGVIATSITASIGNSIVKENKEKNYRDFNRIQLLYMWVSGFCVVSLFCLYQPFMKIWVGEQLMFDDGTMLFFCIYFFVSRWGDICFAYRQAAGLWWQDRVRPIIEALLNITLNIILVQVIGVVGVLLSTILGLIFVNSVWGSKILFKYYFTNFNQAKYIGRLMIFTITTMIVCGIVKAVSETCIVILNIDNLIAVLSIKLMFCCAIPNILFFIVYSKLPEFNDSKALLIKVLHTRINRY